MLWHLPDDTNVRFYCNHLLYVRKRSQTKSQHGVRSNFDLSLLFIRFSYVWLDCHKFFRPRWKVQKDPSQSANGTRIVYRITEPLRMKWFKYDFAKTKYTTWAHNFSYETGLNFEASADFDTITTYLSNTICHVHMTRSDSSFARLKFKWIIIPLWFVVRRRDVPRVVGGYGNNTLVIVVWRRTTYHECVVAVTPDRPWSIP